MYGTEYHAWTIEENVRRKAAAFVSALDEEELAALRRLQPARSDIQKCLDLSNSCAPAHAFRNFYEFAPVPGSTHAVQLGGVLSWLGL